MPLSKKSRIVIGAVAGVGVAVAAALSQYPEAEFLAREFPLRRSEILTTFFARLLRLLAAPCAADLETLAAHVVTNRLRDLNELVVVLLIDQISCGDEQPQTLRLQTPSRFVIEELRAIA